MFWEVIINIGLLLQTYHRALAQSQWTYYHNEFEKGLQNDQGPRTQRCLTGYMTDVQAWVDENGELTDHVEKRNVIDVSRITNPVLMLNQQIKGFYKAKKPRSVKVISFAKCSLTRVPTVFSIEVQPGQILANTVELLTLYGNDFVDLSTAGEHFVEKINATNAYEVPDITVRKPASAAWVTGFNTITFSNLLQLDLRKCNIQHIPDDAFRNMPELEALYLGENKIGFITTFAFHGLRNLRHLDLSRNLKYDEDEMLMFEHSTIFSYLENLVSLDLSFTPIHHRGISIFRHLGPNLVRLSLCYTGIFQLPPKIFESTSLKFLDVSGNNGILSLNKSLGGLERTLQVLYAKEVGLKAFELFYNFENLMILNLDKNEIMIVTPRVTKSLRNLVALNLDNNRISTWFERHFNFQENLRFLSLRGNNINLISAEMLEDIQNVTYIGLSGNFMVCNCHVREMFELAYRNEHTVRQELFQTNRSVPPPFAYHTGYDDFNDIVERRKNVTRECSSCEREEIESEGNFLLFDFDHSLYNCLQVAEAKTIPISQMNTCLQSKREVDLQVKIDEGWTTIIILVVVPAFLITILLLCFIFRRNLRYFCITMKNSATLSLINKDKVIDDGTIFNYDVFVSYCNEDRNWVLDQLLPHVEQDCNVSVCLHERDFQVGLSILENIVSCMDRSRFIMLVLSQQFLQSQWCQFEMHLAQHRLLETRREDLVLVLLEDIPRRLRPTTLHYLMLTKTYIVWPQQESDQPAFWKRMTRSLIRRSQENISLA